MERPSINQEPLVIDESTVELVNQLLLVKHEG